MGEPAGQIDSCGARKRPVLPDLFVQLTARQSCAKPAFRVNRAFKIMH